jgi:hypothetical protein
MLGPGVYDDLCTYVREAADADGVVLLIFRGNKGDGMSAQCIAPLLLNLPGLLRDSAKQIEESGHKA